MKTVYGSTAIHQIDKSTDSVIMEPMIHFRMMFVSINKFKITVNIIV